MTSFLQPGLGGISGSAPTSTDTSALKAINSQDQPFVNQDFVKNIAWLNNSVDTLSAWSQKLQAGVDKNSQDVISQIQGIWADLFAMVAGFEPTGINIGDIKYVLQGLGALLGIDPGTPFPLNLFDAAIHMFTTYIVPSTQFTDIIFNTIDAWAPVFGLDPTFMDSVHQLEAAITDLTSSLPDLMGAVQNLVDAFGPDFGPLSALFDEMTNLFDAVDLSALKPVISTLADLGIPFIDALTAIVNAGNAFLSPLSAISGAQISTLGTNIVPVVSANTTQWTVGSNDINAWVYDADTTPDGSTDGSLTTLGNGTLKVVETQASYVANPGAVFVVNAKVNWTGIPTGATGFGVQLRWVDFNVETSATSVNIPAGHSADSGTWTALAQTEITVPQNVDHLKVGAYVDTSITTGQVWVSAISVQLKGTINQDAITGLIDTLNEFIPFSAFDSIIGTVGTTADDLVTLFQGLLPISAFAGLVSGGVADLASVIQFFEGLIPFSFFDQIIGIVGATPEEVASFFNGFISLTSPLTDIQTFVTESLTPAGVLTSLTQIPAHLFGNLSAAPQNILPDGSFDKATDFAGSGIWQWDSDGKTNPGCALVVADGTLKRLLTTPVPLSANQSDSLPAGTSVKWDSVIASAGPAFSVAINSHTGLNTDGTVIQPAITDPNRVVVSVNSPAASASWTDIIANFTPPAGAKYLVFCLEVQPSVTAGNVRFDDCELNVSQRIDASMLGNIENIPQLLGASIQGFQGLPDLIATLGHLVDGLGTSVTSESQSGLSFSGLFGQVQNMAESALSALGLAQTHEQTMSVQTVAPNMSGLDPTAEATFDLTDLPHGTTLPTTTLATGSSISGFVNLKKAATKGFIEILASIPTGSSNVFANLYSVDMSSGLRSLLWGSDDVSGLIPSTVNWAKFPIPGDEQPTIDVGVQTQIEIVNKSGQTLTLVYKQQPQPNRTSGIIRNFGAVRTPTTTSPATVADSAYTYNGITPWISLGILDVPVGYEPPILKKFTTTPTGYEGAAAQTNQIQTYTLPDWFRLGIDYVDWTALGSGGGGDSGVGGAGSPGGDTIVIIDGVNHVGAHGNPGNNGGGLTTSDFQGKGAGSITYNGQLYQAGGNVGDAQYGSIPGGGGGGGVQPVGYTTYYGQGGYAGNWAHGTVQPTTRTITVSLGYGGRGSTSFNAGTGADGAAWLKIYQNTAVPA